MIVPNKFISLDQSLISKLPELLASLETDRSVLELYESNRHGFEDVSEFLIALDVLYVLGRIELDSGSGTLQLC
jgi:hypothetical protein